jgi:predicted dehydrogenase
MTTRIGILGFAHAHVGMYCSRWTEMSRERVMLTAGWDHDRARLDTAVEAYGLTACDSPAALVAHDDVDAVVIGAETNRHADLVVAAAEAGKAIVLQKPIATTMEDAARIVDAVQSSGVRFTLAWQMRIDPQNLKIKELLESGVLGRLLMIRRRHGLSAHLWPDFDQSWHCDPKQNVGMWADDASHAIDFLYWLLGMPETVYSDIDTLLNPDIPDDHGIAIYRYADGTFAEVMSSFTCVAGENTTEVVCEKGVIIQNYGDGPSCNVPRDDDRGLKWYLQESGEWTRCDIPSPANHSHRIFALAEPILEFLAEGRHTLASAEEGRDSLHMTLSCYDAAQDGRRISLK